MKAIITAEPVFYLELSKDLVFLLNSLSESHYDSTCNAASKQGGFLFGWKTSVDFGVKCKASFNELDLTLKLCEELNRNKLPKQLKVIDSKCNLLDNYKLLVESCLTKSRELDDFKINVALKHDVD